MDRNPSSFLPKSERNSDPKQHLYFNSNNKKDQEIGQHKEANRKPLSKEDDVWKAKGCTKIKK